MRIVFDRPVDRESVASRFSLRPAAEGRVSWASPTEMQYLLHAPLRTDTQYRVLLRAGYRSLGGGAADLDHAWSFRTEGPLEVTGWSPGGAEGDVDPAAFLTVSFNHRLSTAGLAAAFSIAPSVPIQAEVDPVDPFRAVVAPQGLLSADTTYRLLATSAVHDADGNPLAANTSTTFATGAVRALHAWLTCVATDGSLQALDPNHQGRELLPGPVLDYNWAPSADELAIETSSQAWADEVLGDPPVPLPIAADTVLPLGGGRGFVYLDQGTLGFLSSSGATTMLAANVEAVALARDGTQLAYTVPAADGTEIWGLTVELRSRYQLGKESGAVAGLAWSPDGSRLAYRVTTATATSVRVTTLGSSDTVTAVTGAVDEASWDADSQHLYLVIRQGPASVLRIYRLTVTSSPQSPPVGPGLAGGGLAISSGPALVSADGHQVAFLASLGAHPPEVWLVNADGTGLVRLTGGPVYSYSCRAPRWTPPA